MQYNVFGSKHRLNVQGNEENSVNIATVKCLLLNSETNTDTETNFRILPSIYFFFGIKNVRVSSKILGSVGRSETHIFYFLPNFWSCVCLSELFAWHPPSETYPNTLLSQKVIELVDDGYKMRFRHIQVCSTGIRAYGNRN